jgi:hypothetical protein
MTTENKKTTLGSFIITALMTSLFFPAVILLASGNWLWLEGWIFSLWFDAMVLSTLIYMYRHDPALLAERSKPLGADNQKPWDKYLLSLIYINGDHLVNPHAIGCEQVRMESRLSVVDESYRRSSASPSFIPDLSSDG